MQPASIFTDHMVFQAGMPIRIFGVGKGIVKVDFLGIRTEKSSEEDNWCIEFPPQSYGGPYEMELTLNDEKITLKDIYIGEVWIAAGQSNMEMPLFRTEYGIEEAKYSANEKIRFFTVPRRVEKNTPIYGWHFEKRTGDDTPWEVLNEESALHFSAIGYYTAKELQQKLGVAIGVISCNWGGQPIETFIKREYFNDCDALKPAIEAYNKMMSELNWEEYTEKYHNAMKKWEDFYNAIDYDEVEEVREKGVRATAGMPERPTPWFPNGPYVAYMKGCLYESMISRIAPFGIKGVWWYQGESNASENYFEKYLTYMKCMRDTFKNPDMPFYAIELASFSCWWRDDKQETDDRFVTGSNWAFTREQQQKATEADENNYLVTSMELGDLYDIHPIQKRELSYRLARKVLKHTYEFDIYADQPVFERVEFKEGKAYITLKNADGLYCKNLAGVKMYLADNEKILKRADVEIKDNMLVLSADEIKNPSCVRYGFDYYYSGCHIYNKAGLPLAPFRTDKNL